MGQRLILMCLSLGFAMLSGQPARWRVPPITRRSWTNGPPSTAGTANVAYRQQLARAILLGLEVLAAADIIATVAVSPSLTTVAVLAGIVLVRTFLSFSLEVESEGRLPWRRDRAVRRDERS